MVTGECGPMMSARDGAQRIHGTARRFRRARSPARATAAHGGADARTYQRARAEQRGAATPDPAAGRLRRRQAGMAELSENGGAWRPGPGFPQTALQRPSQSVQPAGKGRAMDAGGPIGSARGRGSLAVGAQLCAVPAGAQCGPDTRQPGNMPARFPPRRSGKAALAATGAEAWRMSAANPNRSGNRGLRARLEARPRMQALAPPIARRRRLGRHGMRA